MVNNMWEKDTLFLLFEEDFRFTPTDIEPQVSHQPEGLIELVGDHATFLSSADAESQIGAQAKFGIPGKGRWYEMPTKETDHVSFATPNSVLNDVVRYATLAHRAGCGDLTWMCWQPGGAGSHPKRICSPASGSMFIMLSVPGAEVLTGAMDGGVFPMGHFDVKLLDWLRDLQLSSLRCSYLLPPMGNYGAHQSGCEQAFSGEASIRPSCWQEKWCCPGTRISEDVQGREKWLCAFTSKGQPGWLKKLPNLDGVPCIELEWLSFWDVPGQPRPVAVKDLPNQLEQKAPPPTATSSSAPAWPIPDVTSKRQRRKQRLQTLYHGMRHYIDDKSKAGH
jgi:hypothetical protein